MDYKEHEKGFMKPKPFRLMMERYRTHVLYRHKYREYVLSFGLRGDECVLDFGAGTGAVSRHIAPLLTKEGTLFCTDLSPARLNIARRVMRKFSNVIYQTGRVENLDIPAGSLDVAVIHNMIHDVAPTGRDEILAFIRERLKDGGKLFIREPVNPEHGIPVDELEAMLDRNGFKKVSMEMQMIFKPVAAGVFTKE